jgi:hypothetical protein
MATMPATTISDGAVNSRLTCGVAAADGGGVGGIIICSSEIV